MGDGIGRIECLRSSIAVDSGASDAVVTVDMTATVDGNDHAEEDDDEDDATESQYLESRALTDESPRESGARHTSRLFAPAFAPALAAAVLVYVAVAAMPTGRCASFIATSMFISVAVWLDVS